LSKARALEVGTKISNIRIAHLCFCGSWTFWEKRLKPLRSCRNPLEAMALPSSGEILPSLAPETSGYVIDMLLSLKKMNGVHFL
jgi:hypothetical protein